MHRLQDIQQDFRQDPRLRLSFPEAVLLWALRADAEVPGLGNNEAAPHRRALTRALTGAGMAHAEGYILGFLWALRHGQVRLPALNPMNAAPITADERLVLDAPGLIHSGRGIEAVLLLRGLMAPAAVRAALVSLERLAEIAAAAGHPPPAHDRDTTRFAMPIRAGQHAATLH